MGDPNRTQPHSDPAAEAGDPSRATSAADGMQGDEQEEVIDDLKQALRAGKLPLGLAAERDVSIVYIDRSTTQAPPGTSSSQGREGTRPQRIGDVTINALRSGEVEEVLATFTRPLCYAEAQRRLREQGILVLCGQAGSGKRAAAIHLLAGLRFGSRDDGPTIYELNPDVRLVELNSDEIPARTGLLLETANGSALLGLSDFRLNELTDCLAPERRNSGLVVITEQLPGDFTSGQRRVVYNWILDWGDDWRTVQRQVLLAHINYQARAQSWLTDGHEEAAERLCQERLIADWLVEHLTPGEIAELASLIIPVLKGKWTLTDAMERRRQSVAESVQRWFVHGGHDTDTMVLMVAAAVFNGALADEVEDAAQKLLDLLNVGIPSQTGPQTMPENPFVIGLRRDRRWEAIHADAVAVPVDDTHYGATIGVTRQLRNAAWQKVVIDFVWEKMSTLRDPLLAWLETYVMQGNARMRIRAAAAVGALARINFPLIEARVLRRWATAGNMEARRAAALVIGITIWDETHSGASLRLLHHWATSGNPRLSWTAATAYGGMAGQRYLQQALDDLGTMAAMCVEHPWLLRPVSQSLLNLYDSSDTWERRSLILDSLLTWSSRKGDPKKSFVLGRTGALCFLFLLMPALDDPVWRKVLADMGVKNSPAQVAGIALLRSALNFRQPDNAVRDNLHPRYMARDVLRDLLITVGRHGDTTASSDLAALLHALVDTCSSSDAQSGGADEMNRLHYFAELWDDLPPSAEGLRSILMQ